MSGDSHTVWSYRASSSLRKMGDGMQTEDPYPPQVSWDSLRISLFVDILEEEKEAGNGGEIDEVAGGEERADHEETSEETL